MHCQENESLDTKSLHLEGKNMLESTVGYSFHIYAASPT